MIVIIKNNMIFNCSLTLEKVSLEIPKLYNNGWTNFNVVIAILNDTLLKLVICLIYYIILTS